MYVVSRGVWIGLGDVKLIFIIGLLLDYPNGFLAIVGSVWLATFVGLGLILARKATAKTAIPFGSFIAIVSLLILIYQYDIQKIASRYLL
jgi:prepilin signal peptidase PulO-like enzyme (type II secretory pathway)